MTTVTETAKRIGEGIDLSDLSEADLETICADPLLAQRFAKQVTDLAQDVIPGRRWSIEDLRDILDAAIRGRRREGVRIVEGRYFRKRVREQCAMADRYGDPFAVVVISLEHEPHEGVYQSVLDAVVERLRKTDMVFLYRRRFALVLPRMRAESLGPLIDRVRELIDVGAGEAVIEDIESLVYPHPERPDTQAVLDWAEDQLRTTP
ncbi:MAG TPA: hypothetical protein RMH99_04140 [Sandaracinaceae bacterium LLY-WYZ-13_1]|nr:hypothetical protein [Sandaracinaceae bacterium LLY-WYZ-13_1]